MILVPLSIFLTVAGSAMQNEMHAVVPAAINATKDVVKVFPTPRNKGSITVHSMDDAQLSFYLFDLDGNLVHQSVINKGEKHLVQGLDKGTYLYNAFKNDENLKGGKITLK